MNALRDISLLTMVTGWLKVSSGRHLTAAQFKEHILINLNEMLTSLIER